MARRQGIRTDDGGTMYRRRLFGLLFATTMAVPSAVVLGSPAHAAASYTMRLSSTAATVRAGDTTTTTVSFHASRRLYDTPVVLSVSGLPAGATASFSPPTPLINATSTLTVTTAPSSPASAFTITVVAITAGSDPIGTSTTFDLTIRASCSGADDSQTSRS
jgi:hypothetical protein